MSLLSGIRSDYFFAPWKKGSEQVVYEIANSYDQGLTGFAGDYEYWGYLNPNGGYIIQRHQISTGEYLYSAGTAAYATAWGNKTTLLAYVVYNLIFS